MIEHKFLARRQRGPVRSVLLVIVWLVMQFSEILHEVRGL